MNRMARNLVLILGIVVFLLTTSCAQDSERSVQSAYEAYRAALDAGDLNALKSMVVAEKAGALDSEEAEAMLAMMGAMMPQSPRVESVEVDGSNATVNLTGSLDGQTMTGSVTLVHEGRAWRIDEEHWDLNLGMMSGSGNWASRLQKGQHEYPKARLEWDGHDGSVTELAFTNDGSRLVSIGYDDFRLRLWDRGSGSLVDEVELEHRPTDLTVLPKGKGVAVVDTHGNVTILPVDYSGFGEPTRLSGDAGAQPRVAASADGKFLATTCFDGPIRVWSLDSKAIVRELPKSEKMRGVAFSPKDDIVAAGSIGNTFSVWNLDAKLFGGHKTVRIPKVSEQSDVWDVAWSPDGKKLLTGHMDSSITLWAVDKKKQIHNFYVEDASTMDVEFAPDGTVFASAQHNGYVFLWDTETSAGLARLSGHDGAVTSIAFSPTEWELVASGGEDGDILIWQ